MDDILDRLRSQIMSLKTSGHVELAAFDEIKRNRAAIDELVLALKAYQQAGFGNSTDFVQQKIAAHMARAAITKHTQPKEQA